MSGYTAGRHSNRTNNEQRRVRIEQAIAREGNRRTTEGIAELTGCPVAEVRQVWAQLDIINNEPKGA